MGRGDGVFEQYRTLWITHAGVGHPKRTDTRGRR